MSKTRPGVSGNKRDNIPLGLGRGRENSTIGSQANDVDKKTRGDKVLRRFSCVDEPHMDLSSIGVLVDIIKWNHHVVLYHVKTTREHETCKAMAFEISQLQKS